MTTATELLRQAGGGLLQLLLHPFWYMALLFVALQYRRQMLTERQLFSVRLHAYGRETWRSFVWGTAAGAAASVAMAGIGAPLHPGVVMAVWAATLVGALIRVRFACLAYGAGLFGTLQAIAGAAFPDAERAGERYGKVAGKLLDALQGVHVPALLTLVAALHAAEALLIRFTGARTAMPLFVAGKRGKVIGGFQLQQFWPVPLLLLVPASAAGGWWPAIVPPADAPLPWTPLFGGGAWEAGWLLLPFPVLIGYGDLTVSVAPRRKAAHTSRQLFGYAAVVLLLAAAAHFVPVLTLPAALLTPLLHEGLIRLSRRVEDGRSPFFVHDRRGLKVLAVLPGSPAAEMGIEPGEVIQKVNGAPVHTKRGLHAALQLNPAFCRLEVLNDAGEVRFLQRSLYAGEHHQLGLILCPDDEAPYAVNIHQANLLSLFRPRRRPVRPPARDA